MASYDYRINSIHHQASGAPKIVVQPSYAAGPRAANGSPYNKNNSPSHIASNLRKEAIKSENLKEPLITCPTCKMKLGLEEDECPNCGANIKNKMSDNKRTIILLIIASIILLIPFAKKETNENNSEDIIASFFSEIEESFNEFIESEF